MKKALKDKSNGWIYPILTSKDFDGYERNRPGPKWELVRMPYGARLWKGNNPDFVEVIEYTILRRIQRRLRIWGIKI